MSGTCQILINIVIVEYMLKEIGLDCNKTIVIDYPLLLFRTFHIFYDKRG